MIRLGLCSGAYITRDTKGVIAAAVAAHLDAIEWAAGLHIGTGDSKIAGETMIATLMAGLTTASYATLYRAGCEDPDHERFDALLNIASILQAPNMRIYVSAERLAESRPSCKDGLADELRELGDRAAKKGITICLSMGRGTDLDRYERARGLIQDTNRKFVRLAWEDLPSVRPAEATVALSDVGGLARLLVARCAGRDGAARPIASEADAWRSRLRAFKQAEGNPKMGSFVFLGAPRADGKAGEDSLSADAEALRAMVAELEPKKAR